MTVEISKDKHITRTDKKIVTTIHLDLSNLTNEKE